jgi:membrane fusion protein, multidrug efflux system
MKTIPRLILAAAVAAAVIPACRRADDPAARIARLERQRDALTAEIESLRAGSASTSNPGAARVEAPVPVRIETVVAAPFRHYIAVQGVVESDNNILVPPLSPGIVKKIHVKTGDRVARGRLLAELDAAVLESGIAEVEQALGLAATIYERRARLWAKKIGSEIEYLQAKNGKEALEKKLDTLREQLQLTRIVAPIDGTVDEVLVKEGEMAPAGMGAIRIVQLSRLKVKAALAENYVGRVRPGDPVRIAIPVLGLELERTVTPSPRSSTPGTGHSRSRRLSRPGTGTSSPTCSPF